MRIRTCKKKWKSTSLRYPWVLTTSLPTGKVLFMNTLLDHLNSIPEPQRYGFAVACGTSVGYLRKACSKGQKLGAALCVSIERETDGQITRKDLRPDDWHMIWPELAEPSITEPA